MARQLYPAMLTPLRDGGEELDEAPLEGMVEFLLHHGADGLFVGGSTGEGINLEAAERRRLLRATKAALAGRGRLFSHVGAQTTHQTEALAADAAEVGVDGVAVIPPPYYPLDPGELAAHLLAAAAACAPAPFYIYCFAARSGYPVTPEVVERVRERASNLAGLKVSDSPWPAIERYFELGIPVLVGNEPLISEARDCSTFAGSVSAVAAIFPEAIRALVDDPTPERAAAVGRLRTGITEGTSLPAIGKVLLGLRGLGIRPDVRRPLDAATTAQGEAAQERVAGALAEATAAVPA